MAKLVQPRHTPPEKEVRATSPVFRSAGGLPGNVRLPAVIRREEVRLRSLKLLTVEEDVDLLVIEGDHPGDGE